MLTSLALTRADENDRDDDDENHDARNTNSDIGTCSEATFIWRCRRDNDWGCNVDQSLRK
jgi:hypothetical protein